MTRITRLVMSGFKSFARKTELIFGPDFNCVLGPNGSGKSNILDALTFVLGRRSSKAMRVEKSANLIYNGGKTRQPAKSAEVTIYFDNAKKTFPLEASEISISRIVTQKGTSTYKINNEKTNRNAVVELLTHARINPDSYSIILQGDIVRFVEMATLERREIIEDIAGIGSYEEKKQKALSELEKVEARINEANIILTERKTHLKELEKDRNQALEFKGIDDEIKKYRATFLTVKMRKSEAAEQALENRREESQAKIAKLQGESDTLKQDVQHKKERIREINQDIERRGEREQVALNREVEELKVSLATTATKRESYEQEIVRIKERREALQNDAKLVTGKIGDLEQQRRSLEKVCAEHQKNIAQIEGEIERFKKKNKFGADLVALEQELGAQERGAEEKEAEIQTLRQEQQMVLREKDQIEVKLESLNEQLTRVSQLETEHKEQLKELSRKKSLLKKIEADIQRARENDAQLAAERREKQILLETAQERLAALEAQHRSATAEMTSDKAVAAILELKQEIRGIYGTVAELGQVDEKYAFALGRAAGNRVKSIVVDDDAVAHKCINYLKEQKLGHATFLPLNKISADFSGSASASSSLAASLGSKQGVHGSALDLVSFDAKFKKAFSFVFGLTIVVDDLAVARKIGVGTARMVTLEGDLVEKSGAMQGGFFNKKIQGGSGFAQKGVAQNLESARERVLAIEGALDLISKKRSALDTDIAHLREEKGLLDGEVIKLEKSLELEGMDSDVKSRKDTLKKILGEVEERVCAIQDTLSDKNKELAQLKSRRLELREKMNDLRNPSLIAQLSAFEEKRSELLQSRVRSETELKNTQAQIDTILGPEIKKSADILKQNKQEEERFKTLLAESQALLKQNTALLKEKETLAQTFMKKFKQAFAERDDLEKEIVGGEKSIDDKGIIIKGMEHRVNELNLELTQLKAELAGLRMALEPLKDLEIFSSKTDVEELQKTVTKLELKKETLGTVNLRALEVYDAVNTEYQQLLEKKNTLSVEKDDVYKLITEIEESKKAIFMKNFEIVNTIFKDFFGKITTKGEAYLELENTQNPFEGGVDIKVKLSSKKFMDIKSLSGGEKTLTALAFIFAIQEHDPASFYILDEVDATLDKHNSEKLALLIRNYSVRAQYIVISHNDAIISEASKLYGISMDEHGVSTVTTLEL